jgi:hypothetical protein
LDTGLKRLDIFDQRSGMPLALLRGMNKKFLIPSLAALLVSSTGHTAVAIFLDPVHYKNTQAVANVPQLNLAGYSPITEAVLVGASPNQAWAHQMAENSMEVAHDHFDPFNQHAQVQGSPFEACEDYQMEQLGIALSESGSPLKKYLKDYTKTFGGRVQLATEVQLNSWSPLTLNTQGLASPELNIVEDGSNGVGLNFTPVVEAETSFLSKVPKMSCKVLSAEEITQIAGAQLARLKARHLEKGKVIDTFKMKDLISVVSSTLQTVPRFGYPTGMDVQLEKVSSDGSIKFVSNSQAPVETAAASTTGAN